MSQLKNQNNNDEIYKIQKYEVIMPLDVSPESIFDKDKFKVKAITTENGTKLILIRKKTKAEKDWEKSDNSLKEFDTTSI